MNDHFIRRKNEKIILKQSVCHFVVVWLHIFSRMTELCDDTGTLTGYTPNTLYTGNNSRITLY